MSTSSTNLAGKWALVTGSSSGIGRAIAFQFAMSGANVIVHGNQNRSGAEQTVTEIEAMGVQSVALCCDLSEPASRTHFVEQAWQIAPLDVWVNNAGVDVLTGEAAEWPFEKKLHALWELDVLATIDLSRAVGAHMRQRGQGCIVNIGWDQAVTGMEGDSGQMFGATKGAVMAFTSSLAKTLAPAVRVNCLAPGWIKTDWGDQASEYWQNRARSESLLERWGTPDDVAKAACFLASDDAGFINGQVLNVNGGQR